MHFKHVNFWHSNDIFKYCLTVQWAHEKALHLVDSYWHKESWPSCNKQIIAKMTFSISAIGLDAAIEFDSLMWSVETIGNLVWKRNEKYKMSLKGGIGHFSGWPEDACFSTDVATCSVMSGRTLLLNYFDRKTCPASLQLPHKISHGFW